MNDVCVSLYILKVNVSMPNADAETAQEQQQKSNSHKNVIFFVWLFYDFCLKKKVIVHLSFWLNISLR